MEDLSTILKDYRAASRANADASSLLALVRRYNLPWFAPANLFGAATQPVEFRQPGLPPTTKPVLCYQSFLKGDETNPILGRVRNMATLPQFYRLNWIRQLSTTSLSISLDGNHNRLSHSLGTLDIASRFTRTLGDKLTPIGVKAVLVYAFIHDCFHGPVGHTMDLIKDVIWGARVQERIDKHLLLVHVDEALKKSGFLWRAVRENVADSDAECLAIFEHLEGFLSGDTKKSFMAEIVDGDLDADRIDYIWRDHVHLMMTSPPVTTRQIEDVIDSVIVIQQPGEEKHLHFSEMCSDTIERMLDLRVQAYTRFYENPIKIVADEMLTHAVYYVLKNEGLLTTTGELVGNARGFAEQFSYLTDDGLLHFLSDITSKEIHFIPHALIHSLQANQLFEIVYKKGLKRDNFTVLTRRFAALDHVLASIQEKEAENIKSFVKARTLGLFNRSLYEAIVSSFNERATEPIELLGDDVLIQRDPNWQGAMLPYTEEDDIYRIQFLYGGGFRKKMLLERLLWGQLQEKYTSRARFGDALAKLALALAADRDGDSEYVKEILAVLRTTPLIFINLSWIPGITDQELTNHKRGYSPAGLRFHEKGRAVTMEAELDVNSRDEDYCITICAPAILLQSKDTAQLIAKSFDEFLKGRTWILPEGLGDEL